MITIVDSGANIASIQFALERLGVTARLSQNRDEIKNASHVIIPGVGAARFSMRRLQELQLIEDLRTLTQPVLGICLGMQLLYEFSEEDESACLGVIRGQVKKMQGNFPLPHMGWNIITPVRDNPLLKNIPSAAYVYFVHGFSADISDVTIATSTYGEIFSAVIQQKNFFGVQFHPERSSVIGAQILKNFLEL